MSVHDIEQAITRLSTDEVEQFAEWFINYRSGGQPNVVSANGRSGSKPATLADAMGSLLGALGRDDDGPMSSSRDAGPAFTDYLVARNHSCH